MKTASSVREHVDQIKHRHFLICQQTATFISWLGDGLIAVALPWLVLQETDSAAAVGAVAIARTIGVYCASIALGPFVDRWPGKWTAVIGDIGAFAITLALPALALTGHVPVAAMVMLVFFAAICQRPGFLACNRALPEVAAASDVSVERASGSNEVLYQLMLFAGPAIAGLLIVRIDARWLLTVNAVSFLIAALVVLVGVDRPMMGIAEPQSGKPWSWRVSFGEGMALIRRDRLLISMVAVVALGILLVNAPLLSFILPVLASERDGSSPNLGFAFSAFAVGALVGASEYSLVGLRLAPTHVWRLCYALIGLPYVFVAAGLPFVWLLPALFALGLAEGCSTPLYAAFRFRRIPRHLRGRAFGAIAPIVGLAPTVGLLIPTLLIEPLGIRAVSGILLAGLVGLSVWIALDPTFHELDERPSTN